MSYLHLTTVAEDLRHLMNGFGDDAHRATPPVIGQPAVLRHHYTGSVFRDNCRAAPSVSVILINLTDYR